MSKERKENMGGIRNSNLHHLSMGSAMRGMLPDALRLELARHTETLAFARRICLHEPC